MRFIKPGGIDRWSIMSKKKMKKAGAVECRGCKGTGDCPRCKGTGMDPEAALKKCRRCGGNGVCTGCQGSGWIIVPATKS